MPPAFTIACGSLLPVSFISSLDDAVNARLTDEHVVRFLGEHELTGARQRIEARLTERAQLKLAVAVGEHREHIKVEPRLHRLVESAEDARLVTIPRAALEHRLGFLATIFAKIRVEQVDHRPQVTAFLDFDLKQVSQIVQRRRGVTEHALLLHRRGLGIALGDDDATERVAVLAGHLLPRRLPVVIAKANRPPRNLWLEEDAPAIFRHLHVIKVRPAICLDADGSPKVDIAFLKLVRAHLFPPRDVVR